MRHEIIDMAQTNGGLVSASEVTAAGLPRRLLTEGVDCGELRKTARGLYALPNVWEDDYLVAQRRFAREVFSHGYNTSAAPPPSGNRKSIGHISEALREVLLKSSRQALELLFRLGGEFGLELMDIDGMLVLGIDDRAAKARNSRKR